MMQQALSFAEFTSGVLDSLSWYDLGVDVPVVITDLPSLPAPLTQDLSEMTEVAFLAQAQVLSAQLLMGQLGPDLDTLRRLAFQSSQVMSRELCITGNRSLRMWAQRLNYALQPLICAAEPKADLSGLLGEEVLDGSKPWDALAREGEMVWISSDPQNLHLRCGTETRHMVFDLPTQLDPLEDGALSVGSLYADGAAVLEADGAQSALPHDAPVLMLFDHDGRRCLIDTRARICDAQSGAVLHHAPCQQVHFARVFGSVAYLLNNGDFGHITLVDLDSGAFTRQSVLPVQVCNDIVVTGSATYLIDKQQGCVFAFDKDWNYRTCRLSFGTGRGQLSDPVSLRAEACGLACVSWLSHKRTRLAYF